MPDLSPTSPIATSASSSLSQVRFSSLSDPFVLHRNLTSADPFFPTHTVAGVSCLDVDGFLSSTGQNPCIVPCPSTLTHLIPLSILNIKDRPVSNNEFTDMESDVILFGECRDDSNSTLYGLYRRLGLTAPTLSAANRCLWLPLRPMDSSHTPSSGLITLRCYEWPTESSVSIYHSVSEGLYGTTLVRWLPPIPILGLSRITAVVRAFRNPQSVPLTGLSWSLGGLLCTPSL